MSKLIKSYIINSDGLDIEVKIRSGESITDTYEINLQDVSPGTMALLESVKEQLLRDSKIGTEEIFDPDVITKLKQEFAQKARHLIDVKIAMASSETKKFLVHHLMHEMLGLGRLEILLADGDLEEIVVNTSKEAIWVYHKRYGWLKTNFFLESEKQIQNYSSIIARRVGRQITTLAPLLDAHLVTGDRANATLFPVSTKGNTITIRKFARKPWTITDMIANNTITPEVAAFLWLAIQYELNVIVAGGTSSGKTCLLNTLMPFIQPNHRIISIEDTRELQLPDFLHWVPMSTREPNPEGKGEVSMLQLMVNSLRMRPDRIIVGEIRTGDQAEVLFEAMHTGHSVYATLHAETAGQVLRRMTNPPINVPKILMEALHLVVVQYRDRKKGIRRVYQVAELMPAGGDSESNSSLGMNVLYRLKPDGTIVAHDKCVRVFDEIAMHTGMSEKNIISDISEKMTVLNWLVKNEVNDVNVVGRVVAQYYSSPEDVIRDIKQNKKLGQIVK